MNNEQFMKLLDNAPNEIIHKYMMVTRNKLRSYRRIAVSYSGGSDSDCIVDLINICKPDKCGEIRYAFFNTGLEFDATIRHVSDVANKYGINIETIKPKLSIPVACAKHGIPFMTKRTSDNLHRLQQHEFNWTDNAYTVCKSSGDWWEGVGLISVNTGRRNRGIQEKHPMLKEFIQENNPDFNISAECCKYAKKDVAKEFHNEFNPDLNITGMRNAEGGLRSVKIASCFTPGDDMDEYRPMWFWSDKDKQEYKEWRGITYSDCYEVWGFKRTGCVGCPCNSKAERELEIAYIYEPDKAKAARKVFGKSYEYRRKFNEFKKWRKAGLI